MSLEKDKFCSIQFFCPTDKYKEALRVLRRRNDFSLSPFYRETRRDVISGKRIRSITGVTIDGICVRGRVPKILERLAQRRIAAFSDESFVQLAPVPKIDTLDLTPYNQEAEDLENRRN